MLLSKIRQKFVLLCQNVREVDVEIPLLSGRLMSKYLCCQGCQCQNTFAVREGCGTPLMSAGGNSSPKPPYGQSLLKGHCLKSTLCSPFDTTLDAFQTPLHQWHFSHDKLFFPWWPVSPGVVEPPWICPPYTPCITSYNMSLTKLDFQSCYHWTQHQFKS